MPVVGITSSSPAASAADSTPPSGPLPADIGRLTLLKQFNAYGNRLTGTIPESVGDMSSLTSIELQEDSMGGMAESFNGLRVRQGLLVSTCNRPAGCIPSEIGRLQRLKRLFLGSGWLTGNFVLMKQFIVTVFVNVKNRFFTFQGNYPILSPACRR